MHQNKPLTDKDFYLPLNQYMYHYHYCIQSLKTVVDQVTNLAETDHNDKVISYFNTLASKHISDLNVILLKIIDAKKLKSLDDLPYQPVKLIGNRDVKALTQMISHIADGNKTQANQDALNLYRSIIKGTKH